jgi:hypothetical protein
MEALTQAAIFLQAAKAQDQKIAACAAPTL